MDLMGLAKPGNTRELTGTSAKCILVTGYFQERERRQSVNLEGSISGENYTLGGHSGRPSEQLESLMTGTGAPWEWS